MTREKFIETCVSSGYCSRRVAREYAGDREDLTDDDFVEVYRIADRLSVEHWEKGQKKRPLGDGNFTTKRFTVYNGHDEH